MNCKAIREPHNSKLKPTEKEQTHKVLCLACLLLLLVKTGMGNLRHPFPYLLKRRLLNAGDLRPGDVNML